MLDDLDWCLRQLEGVSSTKSMGNMAHEKFRRLLSRELTQLSEGSREGARVAEWVTNITNLGERGWVWWVGVVSGSPTSPTWVSVGGCGEWVGVVSGSPTSPTWMSVGGCGEWVTNITNLGERGWVW